MALLLINQRKVFYFFLETALFLVLLQKKSTLHVNQKLPKNQLAKI